MKFHRRSGILLHPTSLPGRFGIGDLGDAAFRLVDFLQSAGQAYWQILPLSPTGYADSPYQGLSAFAGNPMLISPETLRDAGLLTDADLDSVPVFPNERVDYGPVIRWKTELLKRAFANFLANSTAEQHHAFKQFCKTQASWLDDFALFMALKEENNLRPWQEWNAEIAARKPEAISHWRKTLSTQIENQKWLQWQFMTQWLAVKAYANDHGVRIIGDAPIYVAMDSADVWANPHLFQLDKKLRPTSVAGVPPDFFSATGQLWGNPLYRWKAMAEENFAWWIARFKMTFAQSDVVRIDHFRGFYNYWAVPADETTAINGKWVLGPGADLFRAVTKALGDLAIIAEDLGEFDKKSRAGVDALQNEFGYPGMKVVQFAFGGDATDPFLPHNYTRDYIAYTGTHDNDTVTGWYQVTSNDKERDYARRYMSVSGHDMAWDMIRLTWSSVAHTAMTTAQDLLALGHNARMNLPGTCGEPNWCWRVLPGAFDANIAARLRELTWLYGRTD